MDYTTYSKCLSNKYFNYFCIFNDVTLIVHCDDIYSCSELLTERNIYMNWGKLNRNIICKTADECSSMICWKESICMMQTEGPSDSEGAGYVMIYLFVF